MNDQACPRCKTTKYRNPSLKLLVNVCGHALCENCVDLLFVRGSGACVECGIALRRNNFRLQLFEDPMIEKEVDIRKRILRDFNKKEEDFPSLKEYNDYLELVETIIFNLVNGLDVEATRQQVEQYKKENQEIIKKNRSRLGKEEEYLEVLIEQERQEHEFCRQAALDEEVQQKQEKAKSKDALIDELMFSDLPADHILATHKHQITSQQEAAAKPRATAFSSGIRMGKQDMFLPVPKPDVQPCYTYVPLALTYCGPEPPEGEQLDTVGYLSHIRPATDSEKGGGYESHLACRRALQDAFVGLYFSFSDVSAASQPAFTMSRRSSAMDTS